MAPTLILATDGLGVTKTDPKGNNASKFHAGKRQGAFIIDAVNEDPDPNGAHQIRMDDFVDPYGNPCSAPFSGTTTFLPMPGGGKQSTPHKVSAGAIVGSYQYTIFLDGAPMLDPEIVVDPDTVKAMRMTRSAARKGTKERAPKRKAAAKKKGAPKRGGKKTAKRRATRKKR